MSIMKIAICGSLDFIPEMKKMADELEHLGHTVLLPKSAEMVVAGETTMEEIKKDTEGGKGVERKIKIDAIKRHYNKIADSDGVLVLNYSKKGIENYIGGNTFLEMGFAHVLNKKIFLLNPVPNMLYTDELLAMQPIILNRNLLTIREIVNP